MGRKESPRIMTVPRVPGLKKRILCTLLELGWEIQFSSMLHYNSLKDCFCDKCVTVQHTQYPVYQGLEVHVTSLYGA